MENDQTYKSAIIDPNTGNPVLHTGLVPKIEDYPPASDADWAELRTMLENFLRSGTDPRSPITCSVQSLVMLLRSCELTRQEADHYSGENPRGPELSGLTAAAVGQALCEALPHVRRQLDGRTNKTEQMRSSGSTGGGIPSSGWHRPNTVPCAALRNAGEPARRSRHWRRSWRKKQSWSKEQEQVARATGR